MSATKLPTTEQIQQRAYELYLERGREDGHDVANWLAAERQLTELPEEVGSEAPKAQVATASTQPKINKGRQGGSGSPPIDRLAGHSKTTEMTRGPSRLRTRCGDFTQIRRMESV